MQITFEDAKEELISIIGSEALRFQFLLDSEKLSVEDKRLYSQLIASDRMNRKTFDMTRTVLTGSLKNLSMLLRKHYDKQVIILIDEYDVPLSKAYEIPAEMLNFEDLLQAWGTA